MNAADLTDDDIGRYVWVKGTTSANWQRVCFEGLTSKPLTPRESERNGGEHFWMILLATPQPGLMSFRTAAGRVMTGLLVRSNAEVWLVDVDYAVDRDGNIVELGEHAA